MKKYTIEFDIDGEEITQYIELDIDQYIEFLEDVKSAFENGKRMSWLNVGINFSRCNYYCIYDGCDE